MLRRVLVTTALVVLSLRLAKGQSSCPVTNLPAQPFLPPAPYLQIAAEGAFWYGTEFLWTQLPGDGKWGGLVNENGYRQKLFFWAKGFDWRKEPEPELIMTGRRLDGDAPDLAVAHANNAFVPSKEAAGMVMAFEIPTAGCWELTAHFHGHRLTYVVLVEP